MIRLKNILDAAVPLALGVAFATGASVAANAACQLQSPGGDVKRVVNIVFDNVHLRRDNPNVPSDLEQMPNLLNFILNNGTISGNHHTPLISHTATDILTAQTGVYGTAWAYRSPTLTGSSVRTAALASAVRSCTGPRLPGRQTADGQ